MLFKVGAVYRDKHNSVDFVLAQRSFDDETNVLTFLLVNVINWIVLSEHHGKYVTNGGITCNDLSQDQYECVSDTMRDYYKEKKK